MKRLVLSITCVGLVLLWLSGQGPHLFRHTALAANSYPAKSAAPAGRGNHQPSYVKTAGDEAEGLELKRQQLAEREAALNAKEQELKKLTASLDTRIREVNSLKKSLEDALAARKKIENERNGERYTKMLKLFKKLRPEESAKLVDKLDEDVAIEMLNRLDQKTTVKLIPYLSQPRVLKWARENLQPAR